MRELSFGFEKILGWLLTAAFFSVIFFVFYRLSTITFFPGVLTYGEGVMTWMSWMMSRFVWPYGNILGVPSVYSCYGFLPSLTAIGLSWIIPTGAFPQGTEMFFAGRLITLASWLGIGVLLASIRQDTQWQRLMSVAVPLGIFSTGPFMYSWRVDPFLCLFLSAVMFLHSQKEKEPRVALIICLSVAVALTKPTALVDFLYFTAFGALLGSRQITLKYTLIYCAAPVFAGAVVLIFFNYLTGGWMLNNIISIQSISGWKGAESVGYGLSRFMESPITPFLLFVFFLTLIKGDARFAIVAFLAVTYTMCTHAKDGGAENYFLPVTIAVSPYLARIALSAWPVQALALLMPVAFLCSSGWNNLGMSWAHKRGEDGNRLVSVTDFFHQSPVLSEDCMYPVIANQEPLVSDIFQLIRVQARWGGDLTKWIEACGGRVLAGGRLQSVCGEQGDGSVPVRIPSPEWVVYQPTFKCRWAPPDPAQDPTPILRYLFFHAGAAGLLGAILRRLFA